MRTLTLVVVGFFWVSGGIYGNEELLGAGPPLVALGLTALLPLLFALPTEATRGQQGEASKMRAPAAEGEREEPLRWD